jgi:sulfate permease, SulP family
VEKGIEVVGDIPTGLPDLDFPSTGGQDLNSLLTVALGVFLVSYIEGMSIGKTFARKGGYEVYTD